MRGHKTFKPKLFTNFNLVDAVPDDNIYKVLSTRLDLSFVRTLTDDCYSHTGRPSLDPVVFPSFQSGQALSANKVMLMAAGAFNLKKWFKHVKKELKNGLYRAIFHLMHVSDSQQLKKHLGNLPFMFLKNHVNIVS